MLQSVLPSDKLTNKTNETLQKSQMNFLVYGELHGMQYVEVAPPQSVAYCHILQKIYS